MPSNRSQHARSMDDVRCRMTELAADRRRREAVGGVSRFLHERAQRWMLWARKERGLPTGEQIRELVASGELSEYKFDPREAAQEYAYEAMEADDRKAQHLKALEALHFDPTCADALRVTADLHATSPIDRVGRLKAVLTAQEAEYAAVAEEFAGRRSDAVELMPLLRTHFDLATALWSSGRVARAERHLTTLLASDADDAVGARYPLLMTRLHLGDHAGAAEILRRDDGETAELLVRWALVLQHVLAGESAEADSAYAALRESHGGEAASLATTPPAELPYNGFFRDDVEDYAGLCLRMLHRAWHAHDAARTWLRERTATGSTAD